jgi:hypothetical protein
MCTPVMSAFPVQVRSVPCNVVVAEVLSAIAAFQSGTSGPNATLQVISCGGISLYPVTVGGGSHDFTDLPLRPLPNCLGLDLFLLGIGFPWADATIK